MRKVLFALVAIQVMTVALSAQTLIATDTATPSRGLYQISWPSSTPTRITTLFSASNMRSVANSRGHYITNNWRPEYLYFCDTQGQLTLRTICPSAWGQCQDFALGQGFDLYGGFNSGVFARMWPTSSAITTISGPGGINAVTRDFETGDFLVANDTTGALIRIDTETGRQTTITSALPGITGMEFVPWLGQLLVTRGASGAYLVDTGGAVVQTLVGAANASIANACCVDHVGGRMFVAWAEGPIAEYTGSGGFVRQITPPVAHRWTGIDVEFADEVSVSAGAGQRGSMCPILARFRSSPNRPYCLAISLGCRPGLSFSTNNNLNLAPDALFFITLCGGLPLYTLNFSGTLGSNGTPTAPPRFAIPLLLSPSDVIYVGGAAVNTSFPDNLDVSETAVIRLR